MNQGKHDAMAAGHRDHRLMLEILASGRPEPVKACAEDVLDHLGDVAVIANRTGLAMLPYQDTVHGTSFHLGEVLVAEAHIQVPGLEVEGYGAVVGRDLEHAMAMAVIDAAVAAGLAMPSIDALLEAEKAHREESDRNRLRMVEATRVQMETF
ncbi:phosphonate C-P lyase system protein PhnG [Rhizobium sp.]